MAAMTIEQLKREASCHKSLADALKFVSDYCYTNPWNGWMRKSVEKYLIASSKSGTCEKGLHCYDGRARWGRAECHVCGHKK